MDYEKKYKEALERMRYVVIEPKNENMLQAIKETVFPELKELEDEKIRRVLVDYFKRYKEQEECGIKTFYGIPTDDILAWLENIPYTIDHEKREGFHLGYKAGLEKQGQTSDQIHYWTEEEIEPIISDYLRGAEHYGGMIGRLRCLKPKSLEKQGEKSLTVNIESMMEAYEQRLINQGNGVRNSPIVNMCVAAFKHGVENTLDELHLKQDETSPILSNSSNIGKGEQKSWSEEDKKEYKYVLKFVDNILNNCGNKKDYEHCKRCYDWLKSLKQKIGGKQ